MLTVSVNLDVRTYCVFVVGATVCAMAVIAILAMKALVYSIKHDYVEMPRAEVIWVEDSPRPTCTPSTPRMSPFLSPMRKRIRRAGAKRLGAHRRHSTLVKSPSLPGDCGFQCLLYAAGLKATRRNVAWLRGIIADKVREARIEDMNHCWCACA